VNASTTEPNYRWVIVITAAVMLAIAMGILVNGLSVFFIPLEQEFGWQRGSIALINTSGLVGLAFGGILMGGIADRTSIRTVCLFGALVVSACILLASRADALWQFYMLFFLAGTFGGGSLFAPLIALVGNWFKTGAGLAIGIASAGQAVGQGGIPFGTASLIETFGWRGAFVALGVLSLVILVPLAMLTRSAPKQEPSPTTDSSVPAQQIYDLFSKNTLVIWLSAAIIFCCITMAVPLMHLVPLIQDRGFSASQASSVLFLLMISAILGRVAFGKLADIIGAIPAYMTASLWQTVLVFVFVQIDSLASFYLFAPIYGFGYAGVMTGLLITVRELTPSKRRAISMGVVLAFAWMGHGIGGYQGGLFFDLTGNYTTSYAIAVVVGVLNLLIVGALFLTIRRRKLIGAKVLVIA